MEQNEKLRTFEADLASFLTFSILAGLPNTNVEGDLKVEHQNLEFKTGLLNLAGNYTEESIQRVAKSMNMTKILRDKLFPHFKNWY